MNNAKKFAIAFTLLAVAALVFGCGQGSEESGVLSPASKLTASAVTSQIDVTAHTHVVRIPFKDVSAAPAADIFQYRSDTHNGHSHVIALSKQQMIDLNNGMRLVLTSSAPNTGTDHTHSWIILGGTLLYDKNCFNCHGNANRGRNPMNVSFTASQTSAEISPDTAPLSTSPPAIPDPNF